jgi:hypothetical protein
MMLAAADLVWVKLCLHSLLDKSKQAKLHVTNILKNIGRLYNNVGESGFDQDTLSSSLLC